MKRFCELLEDHFPPAMREAQLRARIGASFDLLQERRVLVSAGRADSYECATPAGDGCPRRLVDNGDGTCDAVCGMSPPECHDVVGLREKELEVFRLDLDGLARVLCDAGALELRFDGRLVPPYGFRVGDLVDGGRSGLPVYFAARPSHPAFEALAGWVRASAPRAFVLVPTFRFLSPDLESRYDGAVRFVALDRALAVEADRVTLTLHHPHGDLAARERAGTYAAPDYAFVYTNEERAGRALARHEYDALVARAREFELFVDGTGPSCEVLRHANKRKLGGDALTMMPFRMLLRLVEHAAAGDPFRLPHRLGVGQQTQATATRMFNRMRSAVERDGDASPVFQRRPCEGGSEFAFAPDAAFRFCILAPPTK